MREPLHCLMICDRPSESFTPEASFGAARPSSEFDQPLALLFLHVNSVGIAHGRAVIESAQS